VDSSSLLRGMVKVPEDVAAPVGAVEAERRAPDLGVHVDAAAARGPGLGEAVRRGFVDVAEQRGGRVEERAAHVWAARRHAGEERGGGGVVARGGVVGHGAALMPGLSSRSDGQQPTGSVPRNSSLRAPRL
jgi:hypothetical protein